MDDLRLLFDREQEKPLSIVVGDAVTKYFASDTNDPFNSNTTTMDAYGQLANQTNVLIIRGILQSYQLPKSVDYRVIKTFGGDNFIYFFGEEVPMVRFALEFTDGTVYTPGMEGRQSYDYMNILNHMVNPNVLFYGGSSSKVIKNVMASFVFNRSVFIGYILNVDVVGTNQKKGTLSTTMSVILKKYYVTNIYIDPAKAQTNSMPTVQAANQSVVNYNLIQGMMKAMDEQNIKKIGE